MCIKTQTSRFTGSSWAQLERLAAALEEADAVLVGAGAGLSTSAGFAYSGERFRRYFGDFEAAYGFHDMYSGDSTPSPPWRSTGPTGAGLSSSTATATRPSRYIKTCWSW